MLAAPGWRGASMPDMMWTDLMPTKDLRFALDEKGYKSMAPHLAGQTVSYWDSDRQLSRGRIKSAEMKRDRYGNPYIEADIEPLGDLPGQEEGTIADPAGQSPTA